MRGAATSGAYSQAELELSDIDVGGKHFKKSYQTETTPVDPRTESKTRDIREVPKRGRD